ncbi:unnamed protein product [Acanthoscelides obtectus]|uniref:Uncharacterized protein n=1 Tax=Acanthoscelides obtectus TaxID=200917 RepID=A0A9P0LGM9_ACAOB|nr:unnamed protein product [Acanthoscelides obtectus]CAK1658409.1 hypothetical protein AOBTE_LOCUS20868 [Acanthoscelides obtectus]
MEKRLRCKLPKCGGFTYVMCVKCQTSLCFNKAFKS